LQQPAMGGQPDAAERMSLDWHFVDMVFDLSI
jgi:hypothetical protein